MRLYLTVHPSKREWAEGYVWGARDDGYEYQIIESVDCPRGQAFVTEYVTTHSRPAWNPDGR